MAHYSSAQTLVLKLKHRAFSLLACTALVILPPAASAAPAPAATSAPGPAGARQDAEFLKRRNEALGAWLPANESLFEPWRRHHAADGPLGWNEMFAVPAPATNFWYGPAGPPRVNLVYDPRRRVALYEQGCCAWQETVLADVSKPPPGVVKAVNLGALRTRRGIALDATPTAVRRAYGPARLYPSTLKPELRVLSYYRDQYTRGSACGWFENFVFRANRLIEIQAGHGC
jgi:hypothetical protein